MSVLVIAEHHQGRIADNLLCGSTLSSLTFLLTKWFTFT